MELKEFKKLKVGDKVRIVKVKNCWGWNGSGRMDKWLGKIMTVRSIDTMFDSVLMEEDKKEGYGTGWHWFPEMIEEKVEKIKDTIVIKSDGKTVTAYCGKDKGVAVCSPDDEFDLYTGADLALDRLFGKKEKGAELKTINWTNFSDTTALGTASIKSLTDGLVAYVTIIDENNKKVVKEVKRPAKVGEWIKITDDSLSHGYYKNGDILQVYDRLEGMTFNGVFCELNTKVKQKGSNPVYISKDGDLVIWDEEYVVLEGYEPPKEEPKPKVKEVKRKAVVGEYIKIVNPYWTDGMYKKDDILKVVRLGDYHLTNGGVYCHGINIVIHADEYVVLKNYQPE